MHASPGKAASANTTLRAWPLRSFANGDQVLASWNFGANASKPWEGGWLGLTCNATSYVCTDM